MNQLIKDLEGIIEPQLDKYSAYSSEHQHNIIKVTPRGASVDCAKAIAKYIESRKLSEEKVFDATKDVKIDEVSRELAIIMPNGSVLSAILRRDYAKALCNKQEELYEDN
jgi:hypothetical protein